ncbi:MAG: type II toxin-antitoxin system RelE/ParE family toxin [Chitinophagales bacterium]|nr:type II toxin-antitoxin system RelE/ParE family toxin [Chitinophagales bacterium]
MSFKIHLSPEAQLDFDISFEYYLEISPSIALKFKNEFVEALEKLEANPLLEIRYHTFRFFPLLKFPFLSIYTVDLEMKFVEIYAVFHTSRDLFDYPS